MLQACNRHREAVCEVDRREASLVECLGFTPSSDAKYLCDVGKVSQPACACGQGIRKGACSNTTDPTGLF